MSKDVLNISREPLEDVLSKEQLMDIKETQRHWFYFKDKSFTPGQRALLLKALQLTIRKYEDEILESLYLDLGRHKVESYVGEVAIVYEELRRHIRNVMLWARPKKVPSPLSIFPSKSRIYKEAYGNVLIIAPWNYPFQLALMPLIGAISAGNTAVIKPSEFSPNTGRVLDKIISEVFQKEMVKVVLGAKETSKMLLDMKWDKVFFTGSPSIGKKVMEKCAENLTPVTLELGGKSPVIINDTSNMRVCTDRILFGKASNSGQVCVAPDYVLVKETLLVDFVKSFKASCDKMFPGQGMERYEQMARIIRKDAFDRIVDELQEVDVLLGGGFDDEKLKIEPTLVDGGRASEPLDIPFMEREIFGPVLPVLTYRTLDEAIEYVVKGEKPLALYLFTGHKKVEKKVLSKVSFGGGCINDTLIHLANGRLPLGGVGMSGMGAYHGRKSFDTFTHEKSVVKKGVLIDIPLRYMPFTDKKYSLIRKILK